MTSLTKDVAPGSGVGAVGGPSDPPARQRSSFFGSPWGRHTGLFAALVALCAYGVISAADRFATGSNLELMLIQAAVIGVLSVGMTFVIIAGGIDLSVGSLVALSSVWCTTVATQELAGKTTFWVIVGVAVLVGAVCGLVNGLLIAYGPIVPFIMTLATLAAAKGLAERISAKKTQTIDDPAFKQFFNGKIFGIQTQIIVFVLVAVVGWIVLNRTTFGRRTYAVGGNPEAARLAGINVKLHTVLIYVLMGVCCGIAAVLLAARVNSGSSNLGLGYELDAIAAVVIGGTLLTGGRGTIAGTFLGVLIFSVLNNVFILNNLQQTDQQIAKGVIIVIAVLLQQRVA
ncbi:ABC transporter permease, partial [Nakamurella silvestris]